MLPLEKYQFFKIIISIRTLQWHVFHWNLISVSQQILINKVNLQLMKILIKEKQLKKQSAISVNSLYVHIIQDIPFPSHLAQDRISNTAVNVIL